MNPLGSTSSSSGAGDRGAGLHIALPSPAFNNTTLTTSPPLFPIPTATQLPGTGALGVIPDQAQTSSQESASVFDVGDAVFPTGADAVPVDVNLDFTEFDSEGLNALEKIYLFSRSRASFHRVFIVHALPRYLGADESEIGYPSREQVDQIYPEDAVEYVLPLLNGLALDEGMFHTIAISPIAHRAFYVLLIWLISVPWHALRVSPIRSIAVNLGMVGMVYSCS